MSMLMLVLMLMLDFVVIYDIGDEQGLYVICAGV